MTMTNPTPTSKTNGISFMKTEFTSSRLAHYRDLTDDAQGVA
jgi:hypothetical protein